MIKAPHLHEYVFEIGLTEDELLRVGEGIADVDFSNDENVESYIYIINNGVAETVTTGQEISWTFSGDRKIGDPLQDLILKEMKFDPSNRTVFYQITESDGTVIKGKGNITDIQDYTGDGQSRVGISFTLNAAGKPEVE